jgi:hypothetical protein
MIFLYTGNKYVEVAVLKEITRRTFHAHPYAGGPQSMTSGVVCHNVGA